MTDLVTRLRAEIDEDVNEQLDRLLDEAADRIASLEMALVELSQTNGLRATWPTPTCWRSAYERQRA